MDRDMQIFGAPGRYVQGAGAISILGRYVKQICGKLLVVGGQAGLSATREGRGASFAQHGIGQTELRFNGESSESEITRIAKAASDNSCTAIMASGGGKVIDSVKAAADRLDLPCIIVPTVASNDAPCSALSAVYNDNGSFSHIVLLKKSPALVLVDTEIIAKSPVRQLVSGIGGALATWFEAEACRKSGALNTFGGKISVTAMALAKLCLDTVLEFGSEAKHACGNGAVTPALERVVEATTLLSGLGFESGGVAVAHAIAEAFYEIPEARGRTHGEKVTFGLLVHLAVTGYPDDEIEKIAAFCLGLGLPVTISGLICGGLTESALRRVSENAAGPGKTSRNVSGNISGELIYQAIEKADSIGKRASSVTNKGLTYNSYEVILKRK